MDAADRPSRADMWRLSWPRKFGSDIHPPRGQAGERRLSVEQCVDALLACPARARPFVRLRGGADDVHDFARCRGAGTGQRQAVQRGGVRSLPFDDARSTRAATTSPHDQTTPCYGKPHATVWYSWTAPRDMPVGAHTVGSRYDTTIGVFQGSGDDLKFVTCNRDRFNGAEARVMFHAAKGRTYHFAVGADAPHGGPLRFRIVKDLRPPGETLGYSTRTGAGLQPPCRHSRRPGGLRVF